MAPASIYSCLVADSDTQVAIDHELAAIGATPDEVASTFAVMAAPAHDPRPAPIRAGVGRVGPQVRDVAVLGERLAGAREVAASHQPGVQRVQQRAADLADLRGPDGRLDGPADIPEVAFPGGHVPPGG